MNTPKKLVLVTGSSSGIGAGIVDAFLDDRRWIVWGISRSSRRLDSPNYLETLLDLMEEKAIDHIQSRLVEFMAGGEIEEISVIHNFGLTDHASVLEIEKEIWERIFYANVTLPALMTRALSPLMPPSSSHQYIGSTLSTLAVPNAAAYISSKHALLGLMRSAAKDLAEPKIRVNLICPGFTESAMASEVIEQASSRQGISGETHREFIKKLSPLGRLLTPREIGNLTLFLANTDTISGEVIHINGGFGLASP